RLAVLHGAVAGHRYLLFHLGGDRPVAVAGPAGRPGGHSAADPVLRLGAGAVAGGRQAGGGDAGRTHAAPAAVRRARAQHLAAHRRHVHRPAHLVDDAVHAADAATGNRLLHPDDRTALLRAVADPESVRAVAGRAPEHLAVRPGHPGRGAVAAA